MSNFSINDKRVFVFLSQLTGKQILDDICDYNSENEFTTFTLAPTDKMIKCNHDVVEDAIISFKKSGNSKSVWLFHGDYSNPMNNYKLRWHRITTRFIKGDYIEETRKKGMLTNRQYDVLGVDTFEDVLIPKDTYTGSGYMVEVVNPNNVCIFKIAICERLPLEEELTIKYVR